MNTSERDMWHKLCQAPNGMTFAELQGAFDHWTSIAIVGTIYALHRMGAIHLTGDSKVTYHARKLDKPAKRPRLNYGRAFYLARTACAEARARFASVASSELTWRDALAVDLADINYRLALDDMWDDCQ